MARSTTNFIEIQNHDHHERKRPGMPKELYTFLVKTFSLEGDLILDLGSGSGKYICYVVSSALHVDELFLIPDLLR